MKIKKVMSVLFTKHVSNPILAIGDRGVAPTDLTKLEPPLEFGKNQILPKAGRGKWSERAKQLWNRSCSWIQNSRTGESFQLLTLTKAQATKQVSVHRNVGFRTLKGDVVRGTIIGPAKWTPAMKQPQSLGVLEARGYAFTRIEKKLVRENDGSPSRNRHLVAKILAK